MSRTPQSGYKYVVQLSIPPSIEERFIELYDKEHIHAIMVVSGVRACTRYRLVWADTDDMPEHLAIYDVDGPDIPNSPAWREASAVGRWGVEIRPHMRTRRHGMFKQAMTFSSR